MTDVEGDSFGADLTPADHQGPALWAELNRRRLREAEPGLVFNLYIHQRGRKARTVVRALDAGRWTQEELDAAQRRADEWVERVAPTWLAVA